MESNSNNPNTNYPTFQESQIEQSDPLGAYAGSPAPNSSQVYEKPSFQNPNPQPQNPQIQMNNYPNYYQNQPTPQQQQYINPNPNINQSYQPMPNQMQPQPMMSKPPIKYNNKWVSLTRTHKDINMYLTQVYITQRNHK